MGKYMKILRIIFLFFLALIPSVGMGFGGYMMSVSAFPPSHNKFVCVIVPFIVTFVVLFILLMLSDKRPSFKIHDAEKKTK